MSTDPLEMSEFEQKIAEGDSVTDQSIMDRLRQARVEIGTETTLDLDVPHYRGMLVARYRLMSNEDLSKMGQKIRRQFRGSKDAQAAMVLAFACDGLIEACQGMYYRDDASELHEITYEGVPMTFSTPSALAEFLNLGEINTARDAVVEVFGGYEHDMSVVDHYMKLVRWMRDTGVDVSGDLLGEL